MSTTDAALLWFLDPERLVGDSTSMKLWKVGSKGFVLRSSVAFELLINGRVLEPHDGRQRAWICWGKYVGFVDFIVCSCVVADIGRTMAFMIRGLSHNVLVSSLKADRRNYHEE